jgi:hypothetical protein
MVVAFFRMYFFHSRTSKRAISLENGPPRGVRRLCAKTSYQGICQYDRTGETGSQGVMAAWQRALIGYRARSRSILGMVSYLAGVPIGQVCTGSPVSAQWR